ncbi:MAG: sn-glycerol-1-phosphate dehydrogenase [Anaerolineales bacterium]
MDLELPVNIGFDALEAFRAFIKRRELQHLCFVADDNTWGALGARAKAAVDGEEMGIKAIVLHGQEVRADGDRILQVLLPVLQKECVYVAVGSGTLTDITRFVSRRTGRRFISLPTAPSVDAFASMNSPLVVRGFKQTVSGQLPMAIFADLETLCAAPTDMIAAGFGDVLGKYTCLADWRLARLLWDAPYDNCAARLTRESLERVVARASAIGKGKPEAIETLMETLIASGLSMARVGNSRPASGSEHHLSHFWEMQLLRQGRSPILHGAKVGVGSVLMAQEYERIRDMRRQEAIRRLRENEMPDKEREKEEIKEAYGSLAGEVIENHSTFLEMSPKRFEMLKEAIAEHWTEIQEIAATVPPACTLQKLLQQAGGQADPCALGLSPNQVSVALKAAHYVRNRFTVRKLEIALGLEPLQ